jgi:abortive infection bacteriophage resistance protein
MLVEIVEFGTLCRFYLGAPIGTRKAIAQKYGLKRPEILDS